MFEKSGPWQKIILVLYHFLLLTVPLYFSFRTEELFEFNKMVLVYALSVLIGGAWVLRMIQEKRFIFQRTYLDLPLLMFLISQVVSTLLSLHPRTSMLGYYSRFHGGLLSVTSYYLLYYAFVSNVPLKAIKQLLLTAVTSGTIVSIYGILEHFGHSASCLILSKGSNFGVDCWMQKVQERIFATFGQPNWLAAYVITLIPASIYLAITEKANYFKKVLLGVGGGLLFMALIFTQSRSGLLGLGVGMAIFAVGALVYAWKNSSRQARFSPGYYLSRRVIQYTLGFLLLFATLAAIFGTTYTPSIRELFLETNSDQTNIVTALPANQMELGGTDSGEIRKIVWAGALKVWQRYPFFGSGVETFAYSYYLDRPVEHNLVSEWDFLYNKAHNEFLNFLATTGIFGLGTYLLLWGWFVVTASRQIYRKNNLVQLGLLSGLAALTVSNFFGFSTVMTTVLTFLFFAISALVLIKDAENNSQVAVLNQPTKKPEFTNGWQFGAATLTVLAVLILLSGIYNYRQADVAFSSGKSLIDSGQNLDGLLYLQEAVERSPNEALFYDELADTYAKIAVAYDQENDATAAAELAEAAISFSDRSLSLNPAHLNFYKTRARIFISLSPINTDYLLFAKAALVSAIERAPTDAKLWHNLGLVEWGLENIEAASAAQEKAVELKPDYENARIQLARTLKLSGRETEAKEQYRYVIDHISANNPAALEGLAEFAGENKTD